MKSCTVGGFDKKRQGTNGIVLDASTALIDACRSHTYTHTHTHTRTHTHVHVHIRISKLSPSVFILETLGTEQIDTSPPFVYKIDVCRCPFLNHIPEKLSLSCKQSKEHCQRPCDLEVGTSPVGVAVNHFIALLSIDFN